MVVQLYGYTKTHYIVYFERVTVMVLNFIAIKLFFKVLAPSLIKAVHRSCIPNGKHVGQNIYRVEIMVKYAQSSNGICTHHSSFFIRDSHVSKQYHYLSLTIPTPQPLFAEVLGTLARK